MTDVERTESKAKVSDSLNFWVIEVSCATEEAASDL